MVVDKIATIQWEKLDVISFSMKNVNRVDNFSVIWLNTVSYLYQAFPHQQIGKRNIWKKWYFVGGKEDWLV